jgi:Bacterial PH domain
MPGELRFRSAVGWSFKIPAMAIGIGLVLSQLNGPNPVGFVALGFSTALIVWLYVSTEYVVSDQGLRVRSGPIDSRIDAKLIERVRPTRTILSAPALSLDRLEVSGAFGSVVVSPADKGAFVRALKNVAPQMRVEGGLQ